MRSTQGIIMVAALALLCGIVGSCKEQARTKPAPGPSGEEQPEPKEETDRGRLTIQIFQAYQKEVLGGLKAALTGGGTSAAIVVCKDVAVKLQDRFKDLPEVSVRRVALRYRNPNHIPDEFEAAVLAEWEEGRANGTPPVAIARETDQGLRVMQPIMLGSRLCLRCHGTSRDMAPETKATLKELYPNDNAVDFELGDLRGAFSATWRDAPTKAP